MGRYLTIDQIIRGVDNSTTGELDGDASILQVCENRYSYFVMQRMATAFSFVTIIMM